MFDDPKKQLAQLQEQLLAAERPEPEEEPELEDLDDLKELLDTDDWEGTHRQPLYQSYTPAGCEDEETDVYTDGGQEAAPPAPKPKKDGVAGLVAALILETIALVGVVIWWVMK